MNRRAFFGTLAGSLLAAPLVAEAQQVGVHRVGLLLQASPPPSGTPGLFTVAMRDLGYVEGQNVVIERRWAEGRNERFPTLAAELVALKPDVIVADSTPAALAAKRATANIPIVIVNVSDPVGSGLIASLSRPGGNVTGSTDFGIEIAEKAVEMLHTVAPKATRIAVLLSDNPIHPSQLRGIQDAARKIGLAVLPTMARTDNEFETAFASMGSQGAGAFVLLGGAPFSTDRQVARILELAAKTRLPAAYPGPQWVQAGGLLSYGSSFQYRWRLTASYVAKILNGARPSELPVQQPPEVELWINLKSAKALGLTIPPSLLQRADQVIE